jgi:hypothetical protein
MKEKIEAMIALLESKDYDNDQTHRDYDSLLATFIFTYDPELLPLMKKLILTEKDFWYA